MSTYKTIKISLSFCTLIAKLTLSKIKRGLVAAHENISREVEERPRILVVMVLYAALDHHSFQPEKLYILM